MVQAYCSTATVTSQPTQSSGHSSPPFIGCLSTCVQLLCNHLWSTMEYRTWVMLTNRRQHVVTLQCCKHCPVAHAQLCKASDSHLKCVQISQQHSECGTMLATTVGDCYHCSILRAVYAFSHGESMANSGLLSGHCENEKVRCTFMLSSRYG